MRRTRHKTSILAALALTAGAGLAACGNGTGTDSPFEEPSETSSPMTPEVTTTPEPTPTETPGQVRTDPADGLLEGELIPPAPGEPGGLPDDREPLDESPIDPQRIRGAGLTLEKYAGALETQNYMYAHSLWADQGDASGSTAEEFATSLMKYHELHVLIGKPVAVDGSETVAEAPVQMYGRSNDGTTFNTVGPITLERSGDDIETPWEIVSSDLQPEGEVKVER